MRDPVALNRYTDSIPQRGKRVENGIHSPLRALGRTIVNILAAWVGIRRKDREQDLSEAGFSRHLLASLIIVILVALVALGAVELVIHATGAYQPWTGPVRAVSG